ncbi:MAG: beta galactosidase jelly roll domain-containing protein [Mariniphaga sp.]|nr:beta galactosidase jelly roll domain-containing protein [Mariniphaga sp.]
MKNYAFQIFKSLILILFVTNSFNSFSTDIILTRPANGAVITDNMPVLTWQAVEGAKYEVWIDGIKLGSDISENWFIPFPLSYGKHEWKVIGFKGNTKTTSATGEFVVDGKPLSGIPGNAVLLRNDWKVLSSINAGNDGAKLTSKVNTSKWKSTSVPATALSVMVRNGLYPNPYVGVNNMKIPDINDEFTEKYDLMQYSHIKGKNPWQDAYWYRKEFKIPEGYKGKKIWLNLGEINYRAEVWLNGQQIADSSEVVGMERHFRFEITSMAELDGNNILAIAIYPPDHPGKPADAPITPLASPGENMADGVISHDYTKWDVMGWDWQPAIRDRDMGITEDVYLSATDDIEIDNLYVTSDLPLPSTVFADITISLDIVNHSNVTKEGILNAVISSDGADINLEQSYTVEPNDTLEILWSKKNMPQLHLKNPKLWWPIGYGDPNLYMLKIETKTNSGDMSEACIDFGIREVETYIGAFERVYKVNGKEIYCKGGNWVIDMMLNWTAKRYEEEILQTKHSNLNMLRVWGPTGMPPQSFFDAADRNGILLWQDFLHDHWGTFRNRPGWTPKESLYEIITTGVIKKYRNHPSLIMWCGGNEGPNPHEELIMNKLLVEHDGRDSKHYLRISNGDGLHGGGPYHTIEPELYFTDRKLNGFSSEIGPSGVPVFESLVKFMPDLGETWMPGRYPIDGVWAYHDANNWGGRDLRKFSFYDDIIRKYYGPTDSTLAGADAYLDKCQFLNYDVYRASLESINSQLWANSSGILLWKSNSSWPSMTWQVYDWYQQAHAGFYGTRKAAAPQYVQFNRKSKKIEAVNASSKEFPDATVNAILYSEALLPLWRSSETFSLDENSVIELNEVVPVTEKVCYLKLEMKNSKGDILSDNFYWLSTENNFKSFNTMAETEIKVSAEKSNSGNKTSYMVIVSNEGNNIALMTELKLVDEVSGLEILPSFWTDNYISLLPDEKKTVKVEVDSNNLPGRILIEYKAFNMNEAKVVKL